MLLRGAVAGFCISSSILLETPNRGGVGQLSPIKAVIVTRSSCAEHSQVFLSRGGVGQLSPASILVETPNRGGVGQLSPIKAVIVTRCSCAEQSQVFVSPRQYFLRLPTGVELGSYPLLKPLLSQEAPARSIRRFLYLLVNTS